MPVALKRFLDGMIMQALARIRDWPLGIRRPRLLLRSPPAAISVASSRSQPALPSGWDCGQIGLRTGKRKDAPHNRLCSSAPHSPCLNDRIVYGGHSLAAVESAQSGTSSRPT